jgi:hypothetical protein
MPQQRGNKRKSSEAGASPQPPAKKKANATLRRRIQDTPLPVTQRPAPARSSSRSAQAVSRKSTGPKTPHRHSADKLRENIVSPAPLESKRKRSEISGSSAEAQEDLPSSREPSPVPARPKRKKRKKAVKALPAPSPPAEVVGSSSSVLDDITVQGAITDWVEASMSDAERSPSLPVEPPRKRAKRSRTDKSGAMPEWQVRLRDAEERKSQEEERDRAVSRLQVSLADISAKLHLQHFPSSPPRSSAPRRSRKPVAQDVAPFKDECVFYLRGSCSKGARCQFAHPLCELAASFQECPAQDCRLDHSDDVSRDHARWSAFEDMDEDDFGDDVDDVPACALPDCSVPVWVASDGLRYDFCCKAHCKLGREAAEAKRRKSSQRSGKPQATPVAPRASVPGISQSEFSSSLPARARPTPASSARGPLAPRGAFSSENSEEDGFSWSGSKPSRESTSRPVPNGQDLIRTTTMRAYAASLTHGLDANGVDPQTLQYVATLLAHVLFLLMNRDEGQGLPADEVASLSSRVRHAINWIGQRQRFKATGSSSDGHASITYWNTHCVPEGGTELATEQALARKESRATYGDMVYTFEDGTPVEKKAKGSTSKKGSKAAPGARCHHCNKPGHNRSECRAFKSSQSAKK